MSSWIQRRRKDQYYRLAKVRGYRSRAAYKLLQTVRTYGIIKPGDIVVDLGCSPGGWLQVAREILGPQGLVLGVDVASVIPIEYPNVKILELDVHSPDIVERLLTETKGPVDTLLSDLAPSIIGSWEVDHARQVDLAETALQIAREVLKKRGCILIKLFQGPELKRFEAEARPLFDTSRLLKPKASRPESSEIYFLGLGFKLQWR
ncbi:RlmE family RNA methyltransferase [Candidatus Bathyarchaeota archaeon]|nr:MAG: hypothetical protein AUJ07_00290 [Crenarchaeota archaeon 13_1_40CM_3_53_5]TMI27523.1 MAG: RlmE family RNA methyltransferase [Candidatus Bathyarchaeota archaeon]TMI31021.1 MAG: RlmE family RNA methyltransferase [Candidatus Bathyarchaeota archaeon]